MTRVDLDKLADLERNATPPPWAPPAANVFCLFAWRTASTFDGKPTGPDEPHFVICEVPESVDWGQQTISPDEDRAARNLKLIAALRGAFPAMAAELAALRVVEQAARSLVLGIGGWNTASVIRQTNLRRLDQAPSALDKE